VAFSGLECPVVFLSFDSVVILSNMPVSTKNLLCLVLICILAGCTTVQKDTGSRWVGFTESGKASYYGDRHQNKKTASGEIYNHELKTAAHRNLPFGSQVRVTNTSNGKSVLVKINDRGPFAKGRVIDLSKSAFSSIGNTSVGLINVKVEVIQ
jgi:rare lipoprotein A